MRGRVTLERQLAALGLPRARGLHGTLEVTETIQAGVLVARVVTVPQRMLARGQIVQRQADAAERYRDDYEAASGAAPGGGAGAALAPWLRTPASEAQVNAISRVRRADAVMGGARVLVLAACVEGASARELGRRFCGSTGRGVAVVRAALADLLAVLADHYFGAEPPARAAPIRGVVVGE